MLALVIHGVNGAAYNCAQNSAAGILFSFLLKPDVTIERDSR